MFTQTTDTTQRSCTTIAINRPSPDRLIHLNRCLTRVTAFTITGPVTKHSDRCYSVPSCISCKQGDVQWLAHAYVHPNGEWRIYGDPYLPSYAATPIRKAIYAAISAFIANEGAAL